MPTQEVRTLAGSGQVGSTDGIGAAASFRSLRSLAISCDGATLLVTNESAGLRTVSLTPPGPPPAAKIEITPSTPMGNGDASLPTGLVTFVVGTASAPQRIENAPKAILCVRSDYFSNMFRSGT